MREAYIVAGFRSAIGKAKKGGFRFYRPDDLGAEVIKHLMKSVPQLDPHRIDDVNRSCAYSIRYDGLHHCRWC